MQRIYCTIRPVSFFSHLPSLTLSLSLFLILSLFSPLPLKIRFLRRMANAFCLRLSFYKCEYIIICVYIWKGREITKGDVICFHSIFFSLSLSFSNVCTITGSDCLFCWPECHSARKHVYTISDHNHNDIALSSAFFFSHNIHQRD